MTADGRSAILVAMAGLPGVGKSAVAEGLARALRCPVLSVDPIEAAMWHAGIDRDQPTGLAAYVVAEDLAAEQLRMGNDVVVDAVNDAAPARQQWRGLAERCAVPLVFVEVVCSDEAVHRRRLSERVRDLDGFPEPSWESVAARRSGFDDWNDARLRVDSLQPLDDSVAAALTHVAGVRRRR